MNQKCTDPKPDLTKLIVQMLASNLISAAQGMGNELLRFLLLVVVALIFGGTFIAMAYGCWAGILLLSLIMLFIFAVLCIFRESFFKQPSKLQTAKKRKRNSERARNFQKVRSQFCDCLILSS
jgi:uncharacterized membrane protein